MTTTPDGWIKNPTQSAYPGKSETKAINGISFIELAELKSTINMVIYSCRQM